MGVTLRQTNEEHMYRVPENRFLRRLFGSKEEEVAGGGENYTRVI
jgi:hypothetical protein